METLSKPKPKSSDRKFASEEDARNCRFSPRKTKAQLAAMKNTECGYDFSNLLDSQGTDAFIRRMEAAEKKRRNVSSVAALALGGLHTRLHCTAWTFEGNQDKHHVFVDDRINTRRRGIRCKAGQEGMSKVRCSSVVPRSERQEKKMHQLWY